MDNWRVAVFVLTGANCIAFAQRQIIAFLAEPIRIDLGLNDTQIGALIGAAFALSYAVVLLPISEIADRTDRKKLIFGSVLTFSLLTIFSGFTKSFAALFAARVAIGASEAALGPAASSLLADASDKRRLPIAMGFYSSGIYLGGGLALLGGGILATLIDPHHTYHIGENLALSGWGAILICFGILGVFWATLATFIKDPSTSRNGPIGTKDTQWPAFLLHLKQHFRLYIPLFLAISCMIFVGTGTAAWIPTLIFREFGWAAEHVGISYGIIVTVIGTVGALLGGRLSSSSNKGSDNLIHLFKVALLGYALLIPVSICFPLIQSPILMLTAIGIMNLLASLSLAGPFALVHRITPPGMRGKAIATSALFVNLVAASLSPSFVPFLLNSPLIKQDDLAMALSATGLIFSPLALVFLGIAFFKRHSSPFKDYSEPNF